jgi:hypothetical protein
MDDVLFCPFCGEAFEGETRCPAHELRLVPWRDLPQAERPLPDDEAKLAWSSPRLGRGYVAFGAGLALVAFATLPLARVEGELQMGGTMLALALGGTPKLWLVPAAAWAQLAILHRRRSPAAMRSARLAVALVACVPVLTCVWTWLGAHEAVSLLAERTRQDLHMRTGLGAYAIALSAVTMLVGAFRLGVVEQPERRPLTRA